MTVSFYARITIIIMLVVGGASVQAAEVSCDLFYGTMPPTPVDVAQKIWPSGRRPSQNTCKVGFIRGKIVKGDYKKIAAFYRAHHPFLSAFRLQSAGGNVGEAIKIGKMFRKYLITAGAPLFINRNILIKYGAGAGPLASVCIERGNPKRVASEPSLA